MKQISKKCLLCDTDFIDRTSNRNAKCCLKCRKKYYRQLCENWIKKHKDKKKEYNRKFFQKHKKKIYKKRLPYLKEWRIRNPQKIKEYDKKVRLKHRQKRIEYSKGWRKKNKEYVKKYYRRYCEENEERIRESYKRYLEILQNYNRKLFRNLMRRAKLKNAQGFHTFEEWKNLKALYNWTCPACKRKEPEIKLTEDHIIPLNKGGSNNIKNIQPLCRRCNCRKHVAIIKYV